MYIVTDAHGYGSLQRIPAYLQKLNQHYQIHLTSSLFHPLL